MNNVPKLREEVKDLAKKAIEADDAHNSEEAFNFYMQAASKLSLLAKYDENQYSKDLYKKRGLEYATRATELKKSLSQPAKPEESKQSNQPNQPNLKSSHM